ncbi:MAG: cation diffusion facilitator family transporter [Dehalococcoidia bacterium]
MAHVHPHGGPGRVLALGLGMTLTFAAVEVVGGLLSGSLALIADAGHMLVDSAGLMMALAATAIARRPSNLRRTYGYVRVEVLVVPLQVLLMLILAGYIVYEAIQRASSPADVAGVPVLIVGALGLGMNILVFRLLAPFSDANLNARAARLEVAMDAAGSGAVITSAIVLLATGWAGIDLIASFLIAAMVAPRAVMLMRHVISILLESTPRGVDTRRIEAEASKVPGVLALHDLHVWSLTPSFVALSAHVEVETMEDCGAPLAELTRIIREEHGIIHVTLQPETRELHETLDCCELTDAMSDHVHVRAG